MIAGNCAIYQQISVHWATPRTLYEALDAEFHFNDDPCPLNGPETGLLRPWGTSTYVNPPYGRAIRAWLAERKRMKPGNDAFFVSERLGPLNRRTAWDAIRRYGEKAGLPLAAHPHMLRHACGYELANQGADTRLIQDYLGHRNIQHTVQYTAANPARFERLWR